MDNPSVVTLEGPERHSVHCLIDILSCFNTPYEILTDPTTPGGLFNRGWRLSDAAKSDVVALARSTGICSDCDNTGDIQFGFRIAFDATVEVAATENSPPIVGAANIRVLGIGESVCGADLLVNMQEVSNAAVDRTQQIIFAHASLMLVSWGWMLPSGVIIAKFFKHRPDAFWYKVHRVVQPLGLVLAIIGWAIALANFNVFQDKGMNNYRHAIMGTVTMVLGLLQPINALFRPHAPKGGEQKTTLRMIWEAIHKGGGYVAVVLAVATIGLGTTILPFPEDQKTFQLAYGVGAGGIMVATIFYGVVEGKLAQGRDDPSEKHALAMNEPDKEEA